MTEMGMRTVSDDILEFTQKIDELSVQLRERVTELFVELFEIGCQPQPTTEGMLRQAAILMEQIEMDKRVKFLEAITNAIRKFSTEQLDYCEEGG